MVKPRLLPIGLMAAAMLAIGLDARLPLPAPGRSGGATLALSPAIAARLTAGYRNMVAAISWMRLLDYYGGTHPAHRDYAYIAKDLETLVAMNPRLASAYYMGGVAVPWATGNTRLSRRLLTRAMRVFPDDWQWPYYMGFNSYWFDHDRITAARYLTQAARIPGAPPIVAALALRMQVAGHDLDAALAVIDQLLGRKQDAAMRATLETQRQAILTEQVLRHLDAQLARLPAGGGGPLARLGRYHVPVPPRLPDGGHVIVNAQGRLVSSASGKRYQLFTRPGQRP
jgi:Flp pilus assembly protein TadD